MFPISDEQRLIVDTVRQFVQREIAPVVQELEHKEEYPAAIIEGMKELGLFGLTIGEEYGGLGVHLDTYALIVEELAAGWMSMAGVLNSHLIMAYIIEHYGTPEQKQHFLPRLATGEWRGGLCITEPWAGSDVQAIRATAVRQGDEYIVDGTKLFVSNGRYGNTFAVLVKTDPAANPPHRGMSCFIMQKGDPGFQVTRDVEKLGYHGIDTVEFFFDRVPVPAFHLVGEKEGDGFKQVMDGLELGRVNVAARGVGVARASFEAAITYAQTRETMGKPIAEHQAIQLKLAEMGTKLEAARLLTLSAALTKQAGGRSDVEVGMAKLYASEAAAELALDAMRIHGGYGYTKEYPVERYYRDAPMLLMGEGTSDIQRLVIARGLLKKYAI